MKLSDFYFELPEKLIVNYPPRYRDESKMMVVDKKTGKIEHKIFKEIINYLDEDDTIVFNDTKVFPARLNGFKEKTGAQIEVFLLRELNKDQKLWDVTVSPARKIRIGNKLFFGEEGELIAEVIDNTTSRGRTIRFLYDGPYDDYKELLTDLGETPIPKYLEREAEEDDKDRYQTIFAKNEGSTAVPSSGLHFSRELFKMFEIKGINKAFITLHLGLGSFRTIGVEDLTKYKIDSERVIINEDACDLINETMKNKNKICVVGATTMRGIESSITTQGLLKPFDGWTNKFIFPEYDFTIADMMVSNFHFSKSILLMMAMAFGGYDLIMEAYQKAIEKKYHFGPYGDAMFLK